jgi:hypothetical protein
VLLEHALAVEGALAVDVMHPVVVDEGDTVEEADGVPPDVAVPQEEEDALRVEEVVIVGLLLRVVQLVALELVVPVRLAVEE